MSRFSLGDLLRFSLPVPAKEGNSYAVIMRIDREYYHVHWLDLKGNPNEQYLTHYDCEKLAKYFEKIS